MTSFARTIVVALLLLGAMVVAVGGDFDGLLGDVGERDGFEFGRPETAITTGPGGEGAQGFFVGTAPVEDFSRTRFDDSFTVSLLRKTTEHVSLDDLWVSRGITRGKSKTVTFSTETGQNFKGGSLQGKIEDTNLYGSLLVRFNGECLFCRTADAGTEFVRDISPEDFQSSNRLSVTTTSSGWRIWAPAVYILDLKMETGREGRVSKSFNFELPSERLPATKGRFVFRAEGVSGDGNLTVTVNGERVFNEVPSQRSLNLVDFEGDLLEESNRVSLRTAGNAEYEIEDFHLIHFFRRGPEENATRTFELDGEDMEDLPGEVRFKINRILGDPTGLNLILRNSEQETRIVPQGVLQPGTVLSVRINEGNVVEGRNELEFVVSGRGGYEITDFRVRP